MEAHAEETGVQVDYPSRDTGGFTHEEAAERGDVIAGHGAPTGTSLRDRMLARKAEVESRTTELFHVPRFEEVLAVELQVVEWEQTEEIITKHMRHQRRQMLLNAADELVAATVAFYEIKEDSTTEQVEDVSRWSQIAEAYTDEQLPDAPFATRERVALTTLTSEQGAMALSAQFRQWMGGAKVGIRQEVTRDFATTTS